MTLNRKSLQLCFEYTVIRINWNISEYKGGGGWEISFVGFSIIIYERVSILREKSYEI